MRFASSLRYALPVRLAFPAALVLAAIAAKTLGAQHPSGPMWDSYMKGLEVLRAAVIAHGGTERIVGLDAIAYTWDGRDYAPVQGRVPATSATDTTGNGRPAMYSFRLDY